MFSIFATITGEAVAFIKKSVDEAPKPKANETSVKEELSKTLKIASDKLMWIFNFKEVIPINTKKVEHYGTFDR